MTKKTKQPPKMTHKPRSGGTVTKPKPTQPTQSEAVVDETNKA
ncbi:hypothetical protein [Marinomonas piezotolerans]|nr:hypothetical protein [Marinomonas piezotolerans]